MTGESVECADDDAVGDLRMSGIFVVAIVVGTTWFYWNVICFTLQFIR